ncbi:hypothetical protein ES703_08207 [subsurface metagenome]
MEFSDIKKETKVCLQKFAEGVTFGYRHRVFEAIDARIKERKELGTLPLTESQLSCLRGLMEAREIIRRLK